MASWISSLPITATVCSCFWATARAVAKRRQGMATEFGQSAKVKERDPQGFKGAEAVAVGDVDGDGHLDLVISGSDQGGVDGLPR
ncbi:MAG: FG-GAP repeat protein [Betaproteobacteria bacterium]|nr:FG-GAP repeat protein [Betaproteobacteria bacterium]